MKKLYFFLLIITLLVSSLSGSEDINKSIFDLDSRVSKLESYQTDNRKVVYKDIDSLYDYIIGGDYKFKTEDNSTNVIGISYKYFCFNDKVVYAKNVTDSWSCFDGDLYDNISEYKLKAIEEVLNKNCNKKECIDSNSSTIVKIDKIYNLINFKDWNRDRIQFMVLTNYVEKANSPMISIGVLAYPSYKKYIPGKFDFWRRYAFYLGVGKINSFDNLKEYSSLAYSVGINIEIQKGFGINFGCALYSYNDLSNVANDTHVEKSFTYGIVLSSELWKNLFNFNK